MALELRLLDAIVMHRRLFPKVNQFLYSIYYLALPLSQRQAMPLAYNKASVQSFYDRDHGSRDGGDLHHWITTILETHNIREADGEIVLICMPRVFGYVFNPVSFWLCLDKQERIRAVLYEVNNTFGERHSYLCAHADHRPIEPSDILTAQKLFHVSPFLEREGHYQFRIDHSGDRFGVWIDYFDGEGQKKLMTALTGKLRTATPALLRSSLWRYPLVSLKAIILIHWQAMKLLTKGVKYVNKQVQLPTKLSINDKLNAE